VALAGSRRPQEVGIHLREPHLIQNHGSSLTLIEEKLNLYEAREVQLSTGRLQEVPQGDRITLEHHLAISVELLVIPPGQSDFNGPPDWAVAIQENLPRISRGIFYLHGETQGRLLFLLLFSGKEPGKGIRNAPTLSSAPSSLAPLFLFMQFLFG
jgi:hypothetical protein